MIFITYWVYNNYFQPEKLTLTDAFQMAQAENKDIFVVLTKNGCSACGKYLESISNDKDFKRDLEDNYIFVEYNVDVVGNEYLYRILKEYSFPISYIFSSDGELKTMALGNRINNSKKVINKVENNRDSSMIENIGFKVDPDIYRKSISNCLRAYLQNKNVISGDAIESIDRSIEACPYFYNLYLKAKFIEKDDPNKAKELSQKAFEKGLLTEFDKKLYSELVDELCHINGIQAKGLVKSSSIVFKEKIIDLGEIKYKQECKFTFNAKNIGDKPVLINTIKASCNCMDIEWEKEPILPERNFEIRINYHTQKEGMFSKILFVYLSSNEILRLKVKGKIVE